MGITQAISRKFLIDVAQASEFSEHESVKAHVKHLIDIGPYVEATADEIDEFDALFEPLEAEQYRKLSSAK